MNGLEGICAKHLLVVRSRLSMPTRQPREQTALGARIFGHAPQFPPKNSADTPTYLSKNGPLAELRLCPVVSNYSLESPTKLVPNRAFHIAINKIARLAASDDAASQPLPLAEKAFRPDGTLCGGENVRIW